MEMKKKSAVDDFGVQADEPGKIDYYEKRFGMIAIEKGFITADDLVKGLTIQVGEDMHHSRHRLLGEIFFTMGVMTDRQVEEVLSHIFRKVR
jgi:hypothetical protein